MRTFFLYLFSFLTVFGYAEKRDCLKANDLCFEQQSQDREAFRQRVQAHRVAYFTEKLALTPAEAERFWPLYNAYLTERDRLMNEFTQRTRSRRSCGNSEFDVSKLSDAEARRLVSNRAKVIDLDRKFHNDLSRIFSPQRVLAFYDAERGFQRELIERHTEGRFTVQGTVTNHQQGRSHGRSNEPAIIIHNGKRILFRNGFGDMTEPEGATVRDSITPRGVKIRIFEL